MKKIGIFVLFFLLFILGFITSEIIAEKRIQTVTLEKRAFQAQLQQALIADKKSTPQDTLLITQKTEALAAVVESNLYFTSEISSLSSTQKKIVISIMGGSAMKMDASDLVMNYTNNLIIKEITPGSSFPLFPRKISGNGTVTVTGIASLDSTGIKLAHPNDTFITLIVEKTGDQNTIGTITIDKKSTNVFLQGKSVFDAEKTVDHISL